jgi:hypothetical protein
MFTSLGPRIDTEIIPRLKYLAVTADFWSMVNFTRDGITFLLKMPNLEELVVLLEKEDQDLPLAFIFWGETESMQISVSQKIEELVWDNPEWKCPQLRVLKDRQTFADSLDGLEAGLCRKDEYKTRV